jgi:hypothetical protein
MRNDHDAEKGERGGEVDGLRASEGIRIMGLLQRQDSGRGSDLTQQRKMGKRKATEAEETREWGGDDQTGRGR